MRIITRMIDHDPVVIWEQEHPEHGAWARYVLDFTENVLDVAVFREGRWHHSETHKLIGS